MQKEEKNENEEKSNGVRQIKTDKKKGTKRRERKSERNLEKERKRERERKTVFIWTGSSSSSFCQSIK